MKKKFLLFVALLLISSSPLLASSYYWVGGTGNWSDFSNHWATASGGTIFHVTIPSSSDDVFFDSNSFQNPGDTVNMDTTIINCHTMDWTGATGSPRFLGTGNLKIYGSLVLINAMTSNIIALFGSSAAGNTITTAGQHLSNIVFDGPGGEWTLTDTLNTNACSIQAGTFYSNDQVINCVFDFNINGTQTAVHLGTSEINVQGTNWYINYSLSIFLDASNATINMTNSSGIIFYGGNHVYHEVNFLSATSAFITDDNVFGNVTANGDLTIYGSNTFDTLLYAGSTLTLASSQTQTVNGSLITNGTCITPTLITSNNAGQQATIYKASGNITLSFLLLKDIAASGGAIFTANNSLAISNVTGWTIPAPPPQNLYWVGGSGSWNDPSHWSTTSGGAGGNCIPSPNDDVYFDSNSFTGLNDTVLLNVASGYCHTMDWTGATGSPRFLGTGGNLKIYGSLVLINAMTSNIIALFGSSVAGNTITTAGQHLLNIAFDGPGGEWTLTDTLNTNGFSIQAGTFYSNDQVINCVFDFNITGTQTAVHLGTSEINIQGTNWYINYSLSIFLDATNATINMTNSSGIIFYGGNRVYHEVNFLSATSAFITDDNVFGNVTANGDLTIYGSNTFDTLLYAGSTLTLASSQTQTVNGSLITNGTCITPTLITSNNAGQQATIYKASGNITLSFLLLKDIAASGGAIFTANNSLAISNVTGWTIPAPPPQNLYWVGGSGSWNDPSHWSTTSGGAGGNCIPSPNDDVYFDSNSFTGLNDTVLLNVASGYCHTMDWTGATGSPRFLGTGNLEIYGSLVLINAMTSNIIALFESSAAGNTITTAGQQLLNIAFDGSGGEWTLTDTLNTNGFSIQAGTFYSNDQVINCVFDFNITGTQTAVHLGTSEINIQGTNWYINYSLSIFLDAANATINMTNSSGIIFHGGNRVYHEVNFIGASSSFIVEDNVFGNVTANSDMTISGSNSFDTLKFINPGQEIMIYPNETTIINGLLFIQSDPGFPTSLKCNNGISTISKPSDTVCTDYIYLQNINANGGALFFAGDHSVDLGGNSGWNWVRCAPLISNVWPGDCNYDLITDNFDLLNIGVAFGDTGYVRPGASLSYTAQPCQDWYYQFINGANVKHADCDGNGIVDGPDSTAISLNYGLTHPARLAHQDESNTVGTELAFLLPPVIVPGTNVSVPITLGTNVIPADDVYGIAFTVNYDPAFIQPGTMTASYTGSWVENSSNHLNIEKYFPGAGTTDIAFTRIDHTDISGYGMIATLNFVASPTASGPFSLSFSHIRVISHNEIEIPIQTTSSGTYVSIEENESEIASVVYPNPMHDQSKVIFSNPNHETWMLSLEDVTGRIVHPEISTTENLFLIEKKNLGNGIYFYTIRNKEGRSGKGKIVIE